MRVRTFTVDFADGEAVNTALYNLAMDYCKKSMVPPLPDLRKMQRAFVSAKLDKSGKPVEVTGIAALATIIDLPLWSSNDKRSHLALIQRVNNYLADRGYTGHPVTVFVTADPKRKCKGWMEVLLSIQAEPANRYIVTVK